MFNGQSISLSEAISAQRHGIVLVWSFYKNEAAQNYNWIYNFVPKYHATNSASNTTGVVVNGMCCDGYHMAKYLYIGDTTISGYADNTLSGDAGGITISNGSYVLRYVIGV